MLNQESCDKQDRHALFLQKQRQRLYPTLYSANSNVQQILDHFAVDYYSIENESSRRTNDERIGCDDNGAEPALKKSKHQDAHVDNVVELSMSSDGHNDVTTRIVDPGKFYDKKNGTGDVITSALLNEDSNTNCNVPVSEETSHQMWKDIINPPETQSDSCSSTEAVTHQESQQPQNSRMLQPSITSLSSPSVWDIWGQIPPKEYIPSAAMNSNNTVITSSGNEAVATCMMICTICQQKVGSSLRYASHLDKCLGIGTMSRNTNSNTMSLAK
jgi:hypothetical protein